MTKRPEKDQIWATLRVEYEGFPLYLRKPAYENIWSDQRKFNRLLTITHILDLARPDGLPESPYNENLAGFDHALTALFKQSEEGLIILVETFGGKRNYYYYISPDADYSDLVSGLRGKYDSHKLEVFIRDDKDWGFLKEYPFPLY